MYLMWGNQRTLTPHNSYTPVIKTNNGVNNDRSQVNVPDYSEYNSNLYQDGSKLVFTRLDNNPINRILSMLDPAGFIDTELKQHYWAASFLLPLGSIFVLSIVVLLMVLFKRCPHIVAGIVAGLLGTIVIFVILMSVNNAPVYT